MLSIMRPVFGAEKNMKLTGCCADIICAINAAKGLSAGALLGAVELVLVAVVVAAGGTADVVKPADVVLDPVVAGGMYGNATPLPNTHTRHTHICTHVVNMAGFVFDQRTPRQFKFQLLHCFSAIIKCIYILLSSEVSMSK